MLLEWRQVFTCFVAGIPRPGGSKQSMARYGRDGKPVMVGRRVVTFTKEAGKYTPAWRADVKDAAARVWGNRPLLDAPLRLTVTLVFERPAGDFGTGKNAGKLKPSSRLFPSVAPDATKCVRSIEDSLNKVVWKDDSRVVDQTVKKVYGDKPGAYIVIEECTVAAPSTPAPAALFAGIGGRS